MYASAGMAAPQAASFGNSAIGGVEAGRSQTDMENLCNRLAVAIEQAGNISERLYQIDMRLTGGYPTKEGANPSQPRPVPNGHLMSMSMGFDVLMERFDSIHQLSNRLANAI